MFELLSNLSDGFISEATLHPLVIHFPIVLFFVTLAIYFVHIFIPKVVSHWVVTGLYSALLSFVMVAKYTGEEAGIAVGELVTNPRAITIHATFANDFVDSLWILFIIYLVVEYLLTKRYDVIIKRAKPLRILVLCLFLIPMYFLGNTGHTGAMLVYKYAAGVDISEKRAEKAIRLIKAKNNQNVESGGGK